MEDRLRVRAIMDNDLKIIYNWNSPISRGDFQEFNFESLIIITNA